MTGKMLIYRDIEPSGRLCQGEILRGVQEPLPKLSGRGSSLLEQIEVSEAVDHSRVIVVSPDCDLLSDYDVRSRAAENADETDIPLRQTLQHIVCCDVYDESEMKLMVARGSDIWRRIERNQDERYHHIPGGLSDNGSGRLEPDYFLDLRRIFSLPREFLYGTVQHNLVLRGGVLTSPWLEGLINRLFHYQGRVCLPNPDDVRESNPPLMMNPGTSGLLSLLASEEEPTSPVLPAQPDDT